MASGEERVKIMPDEKLNIEIEYCHD